MHVGCGENFKQNWIPLLLNLLALIGIGVHGIVYANILPEKVVYHYDAYGQPDRSASTRAFIALYWGCSSPEEASYSPAGRRYLRLVVSSWALWLNLAVLALIFTIFAVLLQNALKSFDRATTFGVYLPFFVFCAGLVLLIFWMLTHVQGAKGLMYSGYFAEENHDPAIASHPEDGEEMKPAPKLGDD